MFQKKKILVANLFALVIVFLLYALVTQDPTKALLMTGVMAIGQTAGTLFAIWLDTRQQRAHALQNAKSED